MSAACGACHGSGWVLRDADIGTEQECFSCDGSGVDEDAAIAPPVAAGSVDTAEFKRLCNALYLANPSLREGERLRLAAHIDAWGAQQREAGKQEGALASLNNYDSACDKYRKQIEVLTERAEKAETELKGRDFFVDVLNCQVKKAEANLKQVNEWREAALASNQQMQELMGGKLTAAEARVKELEDSLHKAENNCREKAYEVFALERRIESIQIFTPHIGPYAQKKA